VSLPLQSLATPRFAVPFVALVALGVVLLLAGGAIVGRVGRSAPLSRLRAARTGGAGVALAGLALVALAFRWAGTYAGLVTSAAGDPAGVAPTRLGRVGLAVPWSVVALACGALAAAALVVAGGYALVTGDREPAD
jgi:hypothetical protein